VHKITGEELKDVRHRVAVHAIDLRATYCPSLTIQQKNKVIRHYIRYYENQLVEALHKGDKLW